MKIQATGFKYQEQFKAQTPAVTQPPMTTEEAQAALTRIEELLQKYADLKKYEQYWAADEMKTIEYETTVLEGIKEQLIHFLKTGDWVGPTAPASVAAVTPNYSDTIQNNNGWILNQINDDGTTSNVQIEPQLVEGDAAKVDDPSTYAGTIKVPSSNNPNGNSLAFIVSETDNYSEIKYKSVGQDLVVTFKDNLGNVVKSIVIKDGSIRADIQHSIFGLKSQNKLKIDVSEAVIVDQTTGNLKGFFIVGTPFDDEIFTSLADDRVEGGGGNNTIINPGGSDNMFGYASTTDVSQTGDALLPNIGAEMLGNAGDHNTIYDMSGTSYIEAGPGADDEVHQSTMVSDSSSPAGGMIKGAENTKKADIVPEAITDGDWGNILALAGNKQNSKGEYEIDTSNFAGSININIPQDYMSTWTNDGKDLILTAVKIGDDGKATYHRIRFKNFPSDNSTSLNITGHFVDMHQADVGFNKVTINGADIAADPNDILIGPKTAFDKYGITPDDLGKSDVDQTTMQDRLTKITSAPWNNETVTVDSDGRVIFTDTTNFSQDKDGKYILDIPVSGFGAEAFVQATADGGTLITVVKVDASGMTTKTVIQVNGVTPDSLNVKMQGTKSHVHRVPVVAGTGKENYGVTINGGTGIDLNMGYADGSNFADPDNAGFTIEIDPTATENNVPGSQPKTVADWQQEIEAASGDAAALADLEKQIQASDLTDAEKADLQSRIDTAKAKIATKDFSYYYAAINAESDPTKLATLAAEIGASSLSQAEKDALNKMITDKTTPKS